MNISGADPDGTLRMYGEHVLPELRALPPRRSIGRCRWPATACSRPPCSTTSRPAPAARTTSCCARSAMRATGSAVNARSQVAPSEVEYAVVAPFAHPLAERAAALEDGWHPLATPGPDTAGSTSSAATSSPAPGSGRCRSPRPAGQRPRRPARPLRSARSPHRRARVRVRAALGAASRLTRNFGFDPGNGVHDIHMNQGNSRRFPGDDGVWQDGGLLIHFPSRTVGGHLPCLPVPGLAHRRQHRPRDRRTSPAGTERDRPSRPCASSPRWSTRRGSPERETVLLLNASPQAIDLSVWQLADRNEAAAPLGPARSRPARTLRRARRPSSSATRAADHAARPAGLKVHGVAYTAAEAAREDRLISF